MLYDICAFLFNLEVIASHMFWYLAVAVIIAGIIWGPVRD